jgi:hypothetical protein
LREHRDHKRLTQANFLCALLVYKAKLFEALCGRGEKLAYLDGETPLPDGVIELVKKAYSHYETDIVSKIQEQIGKMDLEASGLVADVLKLWGLDVKIRLYRTS